MCTVACKSKSRVPALAGGVIAPSTPSEHVGSVGQVPATTHQALTADELPTGSGVLSPRELSSLPILSSGRSRLSQMRLGNMSLPSLRTCLKRWKDEASTASKTRVTYTTRDTRQVNLACQSMGRHHVQQRDDQAHQMRAHWKHGQHTIADGFSGQLPESQSGGHQWLLPTGTPPPPPPPSPPIRGNPRLLARCPPGIISFLFHFCTCDLGSSHTTGACLHFRVAQAPKRALHMLCTLAANECILFYFSAHFFFSAFTISVIWSLQRIHSFLFSLPCKPPQLFP